MPTATINGLPMSWNERGTGRPLVLLHGFPFDARMWTHQLHALAAKFRVIAPDFRGFGGSASTGPFTLEHLADDVHALIDHLKLAAVTLGGLSMGGYVALAYAKKYPATLAALLLIDTKSEADNAEARQNRDRMIAIANEKGAKPIADAMLGKLIAEESAKHRPQLAHDLREIMESQNGESIAHALTAMRDRPDQTATLPSIAVPTLVVVGEKDAITPPDGAKKMADAIPNARFESIPAAGHMSPFEQPDSFNRAVESFLSTQ